MNDLHAITQSSVLLVEDLPQDRELLTVACELDGLPIDWRVATSCAAAGAALEQIAAGAMPQPCLIILDLRLEDGSGSDLLPLISHQLPEVPVLVFSTSSCPTDRSRIADYPQASYLVKPHSFRGYRQVLDHIRCHCSDPSRL